MNLPTETFKVEVSMKGQDHIKFFSQYAPVLNIGDWTYIDNSYGSDCIHYISELPQIYKNQNQGKAELYICVLPNRFRYGVRTEIVRDSGNHAMECDWLSDWIDCIGPEPMTAKDRMDEAIALSHTIFDKSIAAHENSLLELQEKIGAGKVLLE
jgi:hypothetical protein